VGTHFLSIKIPVYDKFHKAKRQAISARDFKKFIHGKPESSLDDTCKQNAKRLWVLYIRLLLTTIDLRRIREISSFYGYVEQFRPKDNYLYCIMLGIQAKERKVQTLFRVRDFLFELSEKTNLELHVQTSIEKVKRIFEKRDFKLCHTVFNPVGKYKLWLLKKA